MSENNEVLDKVVETYLNTKASEKCKNCFCNDLCIFVLLKKGQVTTCEDWKNRVQRVVDRENKVGAK